MNKNLRRWRLFEFPRCGGDGGWGLGEAGCGKGAFPDQGCGLRVTIPFGSEGVCQMAAFPD
jgi:hypothetical protein